LFVCWVTDRVQVSLARERVSAEQQRKQLYVERQQLLQQRQQVDQVGRVIHHSFRVILAGAGPTVSSCGVFVIFFPRTTKKTVDLLRTIRWAKHEVLL
jgi:hypothetical protein